MSTVKNYILKQVAEQSLSQKDAKKFLIELSDLSKKAKKSIDKDIAIIGMAGKFPKADNVDEFWNNLTNGISCIDKYPRQRQRDAEHILRNPYYMEYLTGTPVETRDEDVYAPAGYIKEIDKFDAGFFGIPPAEATYMDPNQRLALEITWQTMEDAGYGGETLFGSDAGVYIGREGTNISQYRYSNKSDPMQLTGSWESVIASRISYLFNFHGPCMLVDTACSGSLVSVHMACKAIQNGECSIAFAGGVNIVHGELKPEYQGGMNMSSVESEDSMIRTFDANANGTVWGEGIAMVMLKPLKIALKERDNIHAVVKGSAINNDGASNALTAPNAESQEQVIVKAWENAEINPEDLSYIEAHGTGTVLGDPIEFKGLTKAFRKYTKRNQFCAIGSLKTNMGHLVASSGIASLFKVIKSIKSGVIAPTINFNNPNPYINFANSPLYVADHLQNWPSSGKPKCAAVSSFGFNKTNCHMVVEEAPHESLASATHSEVKKEYYCLLISAKKQNILKHYIADYAEYCRRDDWNVADLCFTAATGRGHYNYRLCIIAKDEKQLRERLKLATSVVDGADVEGIFAGGFTLVSAKKKRKAPGEITDKERKQLTQEARQAFKVSMENENHSSLKNLAKAYCQGGEVDWSHYFKGEFRLRLSQPTYPLERVRLWAEPKISQVKGYQSQLHPLIDNRISTQENKWIYESEFSNETHWVLADHKIKQTGVVPGTTYLEMARVVALDALNTNTIELADLFFLQPMVVEKGEKRKVKTSLFKEADVYKFSIESTNDGMVWQQHVEGKIFLHKEEAEVNKQFEEIKKNADECIQEYLSESDTGVFQFGPHWNSIRTAWKQGEKALAKLALPLELQSEIDIFKLHPSVLDNAMNLVSQNTGKTYLPFMYKSFRVYAPFSTEMYSLVVPQTTVTGEEETHSYNVVITDMKGRLIARAEGYVTKKIHSFAFKSGDSRNDYLATRWIPATNLLNKAVGPKTPLLVITHDFAQSQYLVNSFRNRGVQIREVLISSNDKGDKENSFSASSEGMAKLLNSAVVNDIAGIVYLPNYTLIHNEPILGENADNFRKRKALTIDALFHLSKSLLDKKIKLSWGIACISSGAYKAVETDKVLNPLAASCAIFSMTLAMETSGLDSRVLDVDSESDPDDIVDMLFSIQPGKIHSLRNKQCLKQELYPTEIEDMQILPYKEEGVYIVSGGLGGLGLAAAAHVASQVKTNIILLGRSELPDPDQWQNLAASSKDTKLSSVCASLLTLKEQSKNLRYISLDVTSEVDVNDLIGKLKSEFGRVNGVFHAAGVAGDGFVMRKSFNKFDSVLQAKLNGTYNILSALKNEAPDFMLLYSSITALAGGEGQSDYAAANAFLDAVTSLSESYKIPLYSVNWPSWNEVGMSIDYELDTEMTPFTSLSNEEAFSKLDQILAHQVANILPADINPSILVHVNDQLVFDLSSELESKLIQSANQSSNNGEAELNEDIQILGKSDEELSETEISLATVYASILGVSEIDIFANFQDMGGNSIIATHLLKVIEAKYPNLIDISDIFSYPSVDVMAEYLEGKLGISRENTEEPTDEEGKSDAEWGDLMDKLTQDDASIESVLENL